MMQQHFHYDISTLKYTLAALSSSFMAQMMHPFDIIRTRFQSNDGSIGNNIVPKYNNIRNALVTIYNMEGMKGFFKGFVWTLITNSLTRMIFFTINLSKDQIVFLSSVHASVISTIIKNPFQVVKTRLVLNINKHLTGVQNLKLCIRSVYKDHGFLGYQRGLGLSLILCTHGIIQMQAYEKIMEYQRKYIQKDVYNLQALSAGFCSKIIAIFSTYPLTTLKTRIQQNQYINSEQNIPKYNNVRDIAKKIISKEGFLGFYKGVTSSVIMTVPANAIYFYFYELFKTALNINQ